MTYRFKQGDVVITKHGHKYTLGFKTEFEGFPGYRVMGRDGILWDKDIDRLADPPAEKRLRFSVGDEVLYNNDPYKVVRVGREGRYCHDYKLEDKDGDIRHVNDNDLELLKYRWEPSYMNPMGGFYGLAGTERYATIKPKQKKGLRQMAEKMTKTFIGWLSPDRQAVHKAFLNNDGELMFTPELQQYLLEKWMEDKDFIALAKRINKEKETNNN